MISRRTLLRMTGAALIGAAAAPVLRADLIDLGNNDRTLSFVNTHTQESLQACYFKSGSFCSDSLAQIDHILRDHRTGDIKRMDRKLLDLLYVLRRRLHTDRPFHIISGYRSPATNEMLRQKSGGIAKNSLHLHGKAVDIRVPHTPLKHLYKTARGLKAGGVGYYAASNFVHVDIGRVRYW